MAVSSLLEWSKYSNILRSEIMNEASRKVLNTPAISVDWFYKEIMKANAGNERLLAEIESLYDDMVDAISEAEQEFVNEVRFLLENDSE